MEKYLTYIKNACNPTTEQFIEDWEPIGEQVLADLQTQGLVFVEDNRLYVVES